MRVLETALLVLLAGHQCASGDTDILVPPEFSQHNGTLYASCKMSPSDSLPEGLPMVYGQVLFKQELQGKLQVLFQFSGFPDAEDPPQPRAVHIHQYGDLSQGCDSTGGHYNPNGVNHPSHPGDFGNFVPQQGQISDQGESEATLFGGLSVIGRAVVVHEGSDDLGLGGDTGSLLHGNAGRRLACCIIGMSSPSLWNTQAQAVHKRAEE
uniref:Superoxide dismutase [Cu-Zn] n=1 Tax=Iconisemion striatum TaxID=60296 RepID=A0A1A7X8J6_9TELE